MKLAIVDALKASPDLGAELADLKEFRRSTRSILKGVALMRDLFERNPKVKALIESNRLGFIVSTSVGEIEITRDFLKDLALTKTARPFLFQLSSHHSTAGFLAQYFGLKGASMTLSNEYQSAEAGLESADILLRSGHCDAVLLYCVDQSIEEWVDLKMYERCSQLKASSGAALVLLGREEASSPLKSKATLSNLSYGQATDSLPEAKSFYDSNTLEEIVSLVDDQKTGSHTSIRPDGTLSAFSLAFTKDYV